MQTATTQPNSQTTTSADLTKLLSREDLITLLKQLNARGFGKLKLSQCFNKDKKTITAYIGASALDADKPNSHRLAYPSKLANETQTEYLAKLTQCLEDAFYFIDICRIKANSLLSHNYGTRCNFPLLVLIADKLGNIVFYDLIDFQSEKGITYFNAVCNAKLDKSKLIHCDIYCKDLFADLETQKFKVCYISKKWRYEILKQTNDKLVPFYQNIEKNFANIQTYLRRLHKTINLKEFDIQTSKKLVDAVIKAYWFNNALAIIKLYQSLGIIKLDFDINKVIQKLEDKQQITVTI